MPSLTTLSIMDLIAILSIRYAEPPLLYVMLFVLVPSVIKRSVVIPSVVAPLGLCGQEC